MTAPLALTAQSVPVPNGSFESPTVPPGAPAYPPVDVWQKSPQPVWFDPAATGGITWDQLSGVFPNPVVGEAKHIGNMDGNQAAYLFGLPQVGLGQSSLGATFIVGQSYHLTVGILGGGNIEEGDSFLIELTYLDNGNNPQGVAFTPVTFNKKDFPNVTHLNDFTVDVGEVQASDPWAGKEIGIQLLSTSGRGAGYWDVDNVRLAAVPEPTMAALAALGAGGLLAAYRGSRRRG
ncbi:MAG: hypothetical protein HY299_18080 [Verrucomicrobia bacterium]|nr:hypothetical protein [Verrucomicrobiota bacterium]